MPSIDVVIPCYEYGRFLRECVGSVLAQDAGDIRVLIVFGGRYGCCRVQGQQLRS